jgi:hypothetical protein
MDPKQNRLVEALAVKAAKGGTYSWKDTPIGSTDGAKASAPVAIQSSGGPSSGCGWWVHSEPTFLVDQGERFARDTYAGKKGQRSRAFDRVVYCAEPLTSNIFQTPEGYWICQNAVIGRSGFQTYKAREIADPQGLLKDYSPEEDVELWRDPEEVFAPATLASFEGKTLTLHHPNDLLDADSEETNDIGHVQNVHKGTEALDSGDWPILADLIIKKREGIDALQSGQHELSCGYTYKLARVGHRLEQQEILGNHIALVPKGRAGEEARIETGALASGLRDERDRRSGKERENVHGGNR